MSDRTVLLQSVLLSDGDRALPMHCLDCGKTVKLVSPVPIADLVYLMRAFSDAHAECRLDKQGR
jgi:hypothetical protein